MTQAVDRYYYELARKIGLRLRKRRGLPVYDVFTDAGELRATFTDVAELERFLKRTAAETKPWRFQLLGDELLERTNVLEGPYTLERG